MKEGRRLDGLKVKRRGRRYECMRTMNNQGEGLVVVCAEHCGGRCGETTPDSDHVLDKEGCLPMDQRIGLSILRV